MDSNLKDENIVTVIVNQVKPYAAFVKLKDGSNGMIHISELSDSFVRDIDKFVSKDDVLNVKILSVDEDDHFYRCSLKQVPEEKRFSTHKNERHALMTNQKEFDTLKSKIPEWIEESLKRHDMEDK